MLSIHLNELSFYCHHGFYQEEKIVGGEYIVDVEVEIEEQDGVIRSLHESINYVKIYQVVKRRMMLPTPLLETIVTELADEILAISSLAKKVSIRLIKMAPPIINFQGQVSISHSRTRG